MKDRAHCHSILFEAAAAGHGDHSKLRRQSVLTHLNGPDRYNFPMLTFSANFQPFIGKGSAFLAFLSQKFASPSSNVIRKYTLPWLGPSASTWMSTRSGFLSTSQQARLRTRLWPTRHHYVPHVGNSSIDAVLGHCEKHIILADGSRGDPRVTHVE